MFPTQQCWQFRHCNIDNSNSTISSFKTRWYWQFQFDVDVSDSTFPAGRFQRFQLEDVNIPSSTLAMFLTPCQHFRLDHVDSFDCTLSICLTGPCRHLRIDHVNVSISKMSTFPTRAWRLFPERPRNALVTLMKGCVWQSDRKLFT